jgi:hypothetical protein
MKKLLWTTLGLFALSGFALAGDCKKCKKDGEEAKEETVAHCGKCEKKHDKKDGEEAKKEETVADCKKCKKDGEEAKEEGTLAGKCKKECDKDGEAEEGTLA